LGLAAVAVALSAALSDATHLVYHFRPIAIAAGSAWICRRLEGERLCATRSVAFLFGLAALLSAGESSLGPPGARGALSASSAGSSTRPMRRRESTRGY
jgi:hypothetical protein